MNADALHAPAALPSTGMRGVPALPALGLLAAALGAAAAVSWAADELSAGPARHVLELPQIVMAVSYGALGAWVTARRPGHRIGSLAVFVALCQGLSVASWSYAVHAADAVPGGAPLGDAALWVSQWLWVPAFTVVPTLLLLCFPDGRLPSARWLPAALVALVGIALATLGWAFTPYGTGDTTDVDFPPDARNPIASESLADLAAVAGVPLVLAAVAAAVSLGVRVRRSRGAERRQVQLVALGGGLTLALLAGGFALGPGLTVLAAVPLPAAIAVAVLRHGLWDLELAVSRSVAWTVLLAIVAATYVAVVEVAGSSLLATALVAIGLLPLRVRVERLVNRAVFGERDDPVTTLARLGDRLEAAGSDGERLDDVAATIATALHARWVRIEPGGSAGTPDAGAQVEVPLVHRGERIGTLAAGPRDGDGRGERAAMERLAPQVAAAAHGVRLARELRRSRERLVQAREEERRRLRADLHDQLGPTLAAIALQVEAARDLAQDDERLHPLLDAIARRTTDSVGEVRRLAHDLRPPALDDLGLVEALREHARAFARRGLDATLRASPLGSLPAAVELAAYRIALEALSNVVRHANARTATLELHRRPEFLELVVCDDGRGVGPDDRPGLGLASMRERATELGGELEVGPAAGGGTRVLARLPLGGWS